MPLDEFARHVGDVLARAHTLFGSAGTSSPAADAAHRLSGAAETARRVAAPDMAGAAVTGYSAFAHQKADALAHLAEADTALGGVLQDAAHAENTAAAASRSIVSSAATHSESLADDTGKAARHRALVAALRSEVRGQQDLVRRHQEHANELSERVRLVSYDG